MSSVGHLLATVMKQVLLTWAHMNMNQRHDISKALETAMLQFEKQDVHSVKLMQLRFFMSFAKSAEINGCKKWSKLTFCASMNITAAV